jgi:hypothetical protein
MYICTDQRLLTVLAVCNSKSLATRITQLLLCSAPRSASELGTADKRPCSAAVVNKSRKMRTARSFSLSLVGVMSIMRLDATFPWPTPTPKVVRMFSTSLVAVPALRRVEPVSSSGPASMAITWSGALPSAAGRASASTTCGLKHRSAVVAPRRLAPAPGRFHPQFLDKNRRDIVKSQSKRATQKWKRPPYLPALPRRRVSARLRPLQPPHLPGQRLG